MEWSTGETHQACNVTKSEAQVTPRQNHFVSLLLNKDVNAL